MAKFKCGGCILNIVVSIYEFLWRNKSKCFFNPEKRYMRMSSLLLSATVRRLLLDRIEATIYSWTVSGDPTNAGMHAHVVAFPYLYVAKISIRQPCLNFTIYSSHMLPCWLCQVDVLLLQLLASNAVGSYRLRKDPGRLWVRVHCLLSSTDKFLITAMPKLTLVMKLSALWKFLMPTLKVKVVV